MTKSELPIIEELTWNEAEPYVAKGCPKLLAILNEIEPSKDLTLIKVRYPFGSIIIQDDVLHLPINQTTTVPITDPKIESKWKKLLGYRSIPTGMITENSLEIYREMNNKVFSVALSGANTGLEIGIVENFGSTAAYTVSSGARSLYMLPKISKVASHKKLKKEFGLIASPPNKLMDHWHIFKELYASEAFQTDWSCELIFLTDKWINKIENSNNLAWLKLKCYIQKKAWEHSELGRRKVILDVVWEQTADLLSKKSVKVDPYVVDTLKHLIYISLGGISGSRPVNGDDFAGPMNEIQQIYMDIYDLGDQIPTIMRPYNFSLEDKPVYYSMQTPMMLSSTPTFKNISSNIEAIRDLMHIKSYVFSQNYGNLKIDNTKFNELIKKIQFNYFHSHTFSYGKDIRPTTEIPNNDTDWLYNPKNRTDLKFSDNGLYVRGCVKISKNEER